MPEYVKTDVQELLRVLAMPFQLTSLLFVAMTSVLLGLFLSGDLIRLVICLLAIWLLLVWLTQYALQLIDDAANGVREAQAASVEMTSPFGDARAWIHPALALALVLALYYNPEWPRLPALIGAALFFPASLGAIAITGHALDALHPGELARVVRGMGPWYPAAVLFVLACTALGRAIALGAGSLILAFAAGEMLLLIVYAGIGGVLYIRRRELGFEPRQSPERVAQRDEAQRRAGVQEFIDGLYSDLRVHQSARAVTRATQWLHAADSRHLAGHLHALLQSGTGWAEPREYARLLRGLAPVLMELRQPALAAQLADAGLGRAPDFTLEREADVVQLATYALSTGRRRLARALVVNHLQRLGEATQPGEALQALRARLEDPAR